jgi:hypothetical protein
MSVVQHNLHKLTATPAPATIDSVRLCDCCVCVSCTSPLIIAGSALSHDLPTHRRAFTRALAWLLGWTCVDRAMHFRLSTSALLHHRSVLTRSLVAAIHTRTTQVFRHPVAVAYPPNPRHTLVWAKRSLKAYSASGQDGEDLYAVVAGAAAAPVADWCHRAFCPFDNAKAIERAESWVIVKESTLMCSGGEWGPLATSD